MISVEDGPSTIHPLWWLLGVAALIGVFGANSPTAAETPAPAVATPTGSPQDTARFVLLAPGQPPTEFACLEKLWRSESGWNPKAENPTSGAYGIPQALPAEKMAAAGPDWRTNPSTQIKWGLDYIADRYGTACQAWSFWSKNRWY